MMTVVLCGLAHILFQVRSLPALIMVDTLVSILNPISMVFLQVSSTTDKHMMAGTYCGADV